MNPTDGTPQAPQQPNPSPAGPRISPSTPVERLEELLNNEASILPERKKPEDVFAESDPIHGMMEAWEGDVATLRSPDPPASLVSGPEVSETSPSVGSENPLRRFALGRGSELAGHIGPRYSESFRERAVRKAGWAVAGGAIALSAFAIWYGGALDQNRDIESATRWVQASLVEADGFEIADRMIMKLDSAILALARHPDPEYRRGVSAAYDGILLEILQAAAGHPQLQAGVARSILQKKTPAVRENAESLVNRRRAGETIAAETYLRTLIPTGITIEHVMRRPALFRAEEIPSASGGEPRRIAVSRDARLAEALIPAYQAEMLVRGALGQTGAVSVLEEGIRREMEVLSRNTRSIPAEVFGPSEALPILSRIPGLANKVPSGGESYEAGVRDSLREAEDALRRAILVSDTPSRGMRI